MYTNFKKSLNKISSESSHGDGSSSGAQSSEECNPEIARTVSECWETITNICSQRADSSQLEHSVQNPKTGFGGWQTVRIFVSSTFNDFFCEREVLVKRVFPELREWCQNRKLKLVECDLRWGVPKDATSTQALVTCLEEIDRCYEANQHPFFLNLLGERYGWIPTKEEVPEEIKEKYKWVDGTSMTFMEILHGALRISNPNAVFFLRDPGFISNLMPDHASRFLSESVLARQHMKVLKSFLVKQYPEQVFIYNADYGGIGNATGRELVYLTGLDVFADQVKIFFQKAIEKAYPETDSSVELTSEQKEAELQWMFVQDKAGILLGRDRELQLLLNYLHGEAEGKLDKTEGKESTIRKMEDWDVSKGDNLLCVVTAEGGWGKTALLAGLVQKAKQEGMEVFYHFVSSTASSGSHCSLLHRLLVALAKDTSDGELEDPEADSETKKKQLRKLLANWQTTDQPMLIVIDGVNELDNSDSVYHLSWLPPSLPSGVRCVVSANVSHLPTMARLYEHPAYLLPLSVLDLTALQNLASNFFEQYGKKLETGQLKQMLEVTKVDNPLWMTLMCEELRIFGDFRMMDQKLKDLPDNMETFLVNVIQRLLAEDETGYVKQALFLTASTTTGLPTDYILQLLGDAEKKAECPPMYWAQARRVLKPYSRTIQAAGDAAEYFTFIHEAMWKAVRQCMDKEEDRKTWHKQLADFYQYSCDNFILRINYLPYQLRLAGLASRLVEFIRKDPDAARMPAFQRSRFLNEHRCQSTSDTVVPGTKEVMICQMCSRRQGGFNPGVHSLNRDVCYLCSNHVFANNRYPARLCVVHAMRSRFGRNTNSCCICGTMIVVRQQKVNSSFGPGPAWLCMHCGFGIKAKTCCSFKDFHNFSAGKQ